MPLAQLPELWSLPANRFLAATAAPAGWGWLTRLASADYLNLLAVAFLASTTIVCYLRLMSIHWRKGEKLHALLALAQVVVLVAAASGALAGID